MYEEYEVKKVISLVVVLLVVIVVFGGWIMFSIFVLPNVPQHLHQVEGNFIIGVEGVANKW